MAKKFFNNTSIVKCFRVLAVLEALSWFFLLVAMYFKHIEHEPKYITNAGLTHGLLFLLFITVTIFTALMQRWKMALTLWALFSALVPGGTLAFDFYALKNGYLSVKKVSEQKVQSTQGKKVSEQKVQSTQGKKVSHP